MRNKDDGNQPHPSDEQAPPRYAGRKQAFEEDTDRIVLPKPVPERRDDDDDPDDKKKADADFDDIEISVDADELEEESQSPGRKY